MLMAQETKLVKEKRRRKRRKGTKRRREEQLQLDHVSKTTVRSGTLEVGQPVTAGSSLSITPFRSRSSSLMESSLKGSG